MGLASRIKSFPSSPGVYLMKDGRGAVIYIGKAKDLKKRVASYFKTGVDDRIQLPALKQNVKDIEYIITETEKEAILLEQTLIQRYKPRYNIILKDDKSHLSVRINIVHKFPGIEITRRRVNDGSLYFGPYPSARACRETIDAVIKFFKVRNCTDREFKNRSRPCIQYQIQRCTAPCVNLISESEYKKSIDEAIMFLRGRKRGLVKILKKEMKAASEAYDYEKAASIRDLISDIEKTIEPQNVVMREDDSYDVIGLALQGGGAAVCVLIVREGLLIDRYLRRFDTFEGAEDELLEDFLVQFYKKGRDFPEHIVLPCRISDKDVWEETFETLSGRHVTIVYPRGGVLKGLTSIAFENAKSYLAAKGFEERDASGVLTALQKRLSLLRYPKMIECVDISNIHGRYAVGSLVSFVNGYPEKSRYRIYNIRCEGKGDDYEMMREVLERRFKAGCESPPDLLIVDGGKGQLKMAQTVLAKRGLKEVGLASIAKGKVKENKDKDWDGDKVYIPGRKNPVILKRGDQVLLFIQRVRDEAHRFGITRYRKRHRKAMLGLKVVSGVR